MIEFAPMGPEEFARFVDRSLRDFAGEQVRSGTWPADQAEQLARKEYEKLLPEGLDTPDHFVRNIVTEDLRETVGEVWWAYRPEPQGKVLFVYWIGINDRFRRRGYASETFGRLEAEARRAGATRIALHVFGSNSGARALYEKLGFETTHVLMERRVGPSAPPPT